MGPSIQAIEKIVLFEEKSTAKLNYQLTVYTRVQLKQANVPIF